MPVIRDAHLSAPAFQWEFDASVAVRVACRSAGHHTQVRKMPGTRSLPAKHCGGLLQGDALNDLPVLQDLQPGCGRRRSCPVRRSECPRRRRLHRPALESLVRVRVCSHQFQYLCSAHALLCSCTAGLMISDLRVGESHLAGCMAGGGGICARFCSLLEATTSIFAR